jgi:sigma-B regulation protein RsbU (phosphoserine phosphatase)
LIRGDDGKSLFFAVGDVAGKGVAASLLMTHLNAIFRSLLSIRLPLPEVMSRANRLFCEGTLASHYATLVCGRASGNDLELCNAGHCPPLVARKDHVERLDFAGLPLGMFCAMEYPAQTVTLGVGDSLVLYSDGVTEALDGRGVEFSEDRLIECIRERKEGAVKALSQGILGQVAEYRGGAAATDDLTVLVVRRMFRAP